MQVQKTYIGDGVYAELENGMIKLTTSDGTGTQNTIYLEVEVYYALVRFAEVCIAAARGV